MGRFVGGKDGQRPPYIYIYERHSGKQVPRLSVICNVEHHQLIIIPHQKKFIGLPRSSFRNNKAHWLFAHLAQCTLPAFKSFVSLLLVVFQNLWGWREPGDFAAEEIV